jgi:hypothetical protein
MAAVLVDKQSQKKNIWISLLRKLTIKIELKYIATSTLIK